VHTLSNLSLADVHQHHHRSEQQSGRVGDILTCDAGGRAMDRLERGDMFSDVCRAGKTDGSGDLCGHIREDVPVEVWHDDHIENLVAVGEYGGPDIDDPMLGLQLGVFGRDLVKHSPEQTIGEFHDVVLGETGHFRSTIGPRVFEGVADDPLTAETGNQLQTPGHFICLTIFYPPERSSSFSRTITTSIPG